MCFYSCLSDLSHYIRLVGETPRLKFSGLTFENLLQVEKCCLAALQGLQG